MFCDFQRLNCRFYAFPLQIQTFDDGSAHKLCVWLVKTILHWDNILVVPYHLQLPSFVLGKQLQITVEHCQIYSVLVELGPVSLFLRKGRGSESRHILATEGDQSLLF
jgi:hypothetical protein